MPENRPRAPLADRRTEGARSLPETAKLVSVLQAYRAAQGLSRRGLSRLTELLGGLPPNPGRVKDIEALRAVDPRGSTLMALSRATGLSLEDLIDAGRPMPSWSELAVGSLGKSTAHDKAKLTKLGGLQKILSPESDSIGIDVLLLVRVDRGRHLENVVRRALKDFMQEPSRHGAPLSVGINGFVRANWVLDGRGGLAATEAWHAFQTVAALTPGMLDEVLGLEPQIGQSEENRWELPSDRYHEALRLLARLIQDPDAPGEPDPLVVKRLARATFEIHKAEIERLLKERGVDLG